MKPRESIHFELQFGGPWTPWWLALALPLVVAAGWYLYRNQLKGIARFHIIALLALRLGLLAGLVFLLFRPSLVYRKIVTYAGRIVFLLDDSESMLTKDTGMSDVEALRLSRSLSPGGLDAPFDNMAKAVARVAGIIQDFERFSQGADRRKDAFWNEATASKRKALEQFAQLDRAPTALAQAVRDLRDSLDGFFTGSKDPGSAAYEDFYTRASALSNQFLDLQAGADRSKAGDSALIAAAKAIRSLTRLDLLAAKLAAARDTVAALTKGQFVQIERLMTGKKENLAALGDLQAVHGRTDMVGRLGEIVAEESDFPLSGIVLFSDGRDLGGKSVAAYAQEAAQTQVPVCTAGVGSAREPVDLAILRIVAPPFAVKGNPVRIKLDLKTSLRVPADVKLAILEGGSTVAEQKFTLGKEATQTVVMEFTPAQSGLVRCTARLESLPGEAFTSNNEAGFALDVLDHKLWVLFADWKPRWETRFALNILQRLDYVELNSIIGIVQEGGPIPRGARKGAWPDTLAGLEVYDLIVLGDLQFLSAAERDTLQNAVEQGGKTLCLLAPAKSDSAPQRLQSIDQLRLTAEGETDPLTRALKGAVTTGTAAPSQSKVLLFDNDTGAPLISSRSSGKGKTVSIDTDELWKVLNPEHLDAHTDLYVALASVGSVPEVEHYPELDFLARDELFLQSLAAATGGVFVDFANFESCLRRIRPKERIETRERVWRLWGSGVLLTLAAGMLTAEWIWRKCVRLV